MVESSAGGTCRCSCQEDYSSEDTSSSCCSPHVFTSILLGVLACVLMTGGVFLAFHRWDPLWLVVSAVGVLLVLIGSILHCCSLREAQVARRQASGGKGGCGRPSDHLHTHMVPNGGSLTEQLLPLTNARSVSQLSLNMLPGYFPPVVTTYGIEQHSAVVQNINRIVQQQQQPPQSSGSTSPGVANGAGKSFILLSLPGDTTQANIQSLVATVYQLDGNVVTEIPATDGTSPASIPTTPPAVQVATVPSLVLKNAEAQTCQVWPASVQRAVPTENSRLLAFAPVASTSSEHPNVASELPQRPSTSTSSGTTQTEPLNTLIPDAINLMDCSPICDSVRGPESFANIPDSSGSVLVDVTGPLAETETQSGAAESPSANSFPVLSNPSSADVLVVVPDSAEIPTEVSANASDSARPTTDVLIDISEEDTASPAAGVDTPPQVAVNSDISSSQSRPSVSNNTEAPVETSHGVQSEVTVVDESLLGAVGGSELSLSCDNLSDIDVEDDELLERSSPPPSYDDVAQEGDTSATGAFGLAYGTI